MTFAVADGGSQSDHIALAMSSFDLATGSNDGAGYRPDNVALIGTTTLTRAISERTRVINRREELNIRTQRAS
jgi:hypothetical protein